MKYAWIKAQHHQRAFTVNAVCEILSVLPTGHKCEVAITRGKITPNLPVKMKISDWAS